MLLLSLTSYVTWLIFNGGTRTQRAPHRRRHSVPSARPKHFRINKKKKYKYILRGYFGPEPKAGFSKKKICFLGDFRTVFRPCNIYGPNPSDEMISRENCSRNSETPTTFRWSPPLVPRPERLSPSVEQNY